MTLQIALLITAVLLSVPTILVAVSGSREVGDRGSFLVRRFRGLSLVAMLVWAVCVELQFWTQFSAWQLATSLIGLTAVAAALVLHASQLRGDGSGDTAG